jgi:hypothetical protein
MEKVCGMTWIGELFFRFQKEPADELSSQHRGKAGKLLLHKPCILK